MTNHKKIDIKAEDFLVIGHRGAKAYIPEETLSSFELAQSLNADYIEMDVHLTRDGHLITMHDDTLKRTTNVEDLYPNRSPWNIEDFTLEEIKNWMPVHGLTRKIRSMRNHRMLT